MYHMSITQPLEPIDLLCQSLFVYLSDQKKRFNEDPRHFSDDTQLAFLKHYWNDELVDTNKLSPGEVLGIDPSKTYFNCQDVKLILPSLLNRLVQDGRLERIENKYYLTC